MANLEKAISLASNGFQVFPLKSDGRPYTEHGFKEASSDPAQIKKMWHKDALVGVYTGGSGVLVLDLDMKVDDQGTVLVDGFESVEQSWEEIPETFAYDSRNGLGRHLVYRAPEGVNLPRSMGYRGLKGVDRCSGEGYVAWMGDVPEPHEIADAPEWLLDSKAERTVHNFEGELKEWYESLTPGEPNALVRKAMERAQEKFTSLGDDFSHSDVVELQFELVRLGAEGNSGVKEGLDFLEDLFLSRTGSHTRTEDEWPYEWAEALQSAVAKYGDAIQLLKNLPPYDLDLVPSSIPVALVTKPGTKAEFSQLLGRLVKETEDDNRILSILWNCNGTKKWAREWGLSFVYKRIQDARITPEPSRENPKIEEAKEREREAPEFVSTELLTQEEREYISTRPTFVDNYIKWAKEGGFVNEYYARAAAWNVASMAFAFHGFIPQDEDDNMGLNIWTILLGESGTGKTRAIKFMRDCLNQIFQGETETEPGMPNYDLGAGSSMEGVHEALLLRDRRASMFFQDEASEFFAKIKPSSGRGWLAGYTDALSRYYEGDVPAENKVRLKELRGKTALTSLNLHMYATPDRFLGLIERDMFGTGFVPRINWVIAPPPVITKDRFRARQAGKGRVTNHGEVSDGVKKVVADLLEARMFTSGKPTPLFATDEALDRLSEAHERMYMVASRRENWDIISPVITRLAETLRKCAGICAMYRSDSQIELVDALHAIQAVEEWFNNAFKVASTVSEGDFQRSCNEIESWIRDQKGMRATSTKIKYKFANLIKRDPRELDSYLTQLTESGILNRNEESGVAVYAINGS